MSKDTRGGSFTALVDLSDQKRLNTLFRHELGLYNGLIDIFESRTRTFPGLIFGITATERRLFQEVAAQAIDWNKIPEDLNQWPEGLTRLSKELRSTNRSEEHTSELQSH